LGVILYNIFLLLFKAVMPVIAPFHPKAANWVRGRKHIFERLETALAGSPPVIWMHCASLGEFEQGRPLLEKLKKEYPGYRILLTFFSPSGYEVRKDYKGADWIFYLPMDGAENARRFLDIVNPALVIFVKYEFWYYYLKKIKYRNIPLLLVSALFWKEMSFFKWYGGLQRKMLSRFDHLFVQDQTSLDLMQNIGLASITSISGDTRFDRVADIAEAAERLTAIEDFIGNNPIIIAGSTWPDDETVLAATIKSLSQGGIKLIIAPHEITEKHISSLESLFPGSARLMHSTGPSPAASPVLIVNTIGLLSRLYRYATIAYIGGGFGKGIHNTLEAAVYGKPIVFGPVFHKFKEASDLIGAGGAFTVSNQNECSEVVSRLLGDPVLAANAGAVSRDYVYSNRGATKKIIGFIQENRLLIN
jgi:3-deoxy-D-manno-octulosonic-acid transferase